MRPNKLITKYLGNQYFILGLLLIILIPTFWSMLKPGIFSMQDPHVFRLYEFDKCVKDLQLPCRWTPDAAFEYGEPLFNFYGQAPYLWGEPFIQLGFSVIDSLKILFVTSIILSALTMFMLAKQVWGNNLAAFLASIVYTYAPYRAVDIYVRGALPESMAFIFFPLITFLFNNYIKDRKNVTLLLFSLSFAGLILTHNLSAVIYSIFLFFWGIYLFYKERAWNLIPRFLISAIIVIGLTSFYLLPVIAESHLITLEKTTQGYFDFRAHFVTLKQLLISRYWGYGASLFGEDDRLSLSVGQIQWIFPMIVVILVLVRKKFRNLGTFIILFLMGWLMLFFSHNKSAFIWEKTPLFAYIQFPWRSLGLAVFCFSLSSGFVTQILAKDYQRISVVILVAGLAIVLNIGYFHEDLWFNITDREQFSGSRYEQLVASSINDFWPKYGSLTPTRVANGSILTNGFGNASLLEKKSNKSIFQVNVESEMSVVQWPIVYFPGWQAKVDNIQVLTQPTGELGLITTTMDRGNHLVTLTFEDTLIRKIGNLTSVSTFVLLIFALIFLKAKKK